MFGKKPRVINIGIKKFYDALIRQNVEAVQIEWHPVKQQSEEILDLLSKLL